ncbi:MAG: fructosamine kinase family protein [Eubacterium sp.]|nr:fructosamine kinase family protein [Eubacterium sp.]
MSITPLQQFSSLQDALQALFGAGTKVTQAQYAAGGDINEARRLTLSNGMRIFMKSNAKANLSFFTAEAAGLAAIARTGTVSVPRVLCCGTDQAQGGYSFLLMDYLESGSRRADYWEVLGQQLAAMHRADTAPFVPGGRYGFLQDNFIGASSQGNAPGDSWTGFFRDCRLKPQFERASGYFEAADIKKASRLMERIPDLLAEPQHPSLLHGDLWGGNVMTGHDGTAWLIDPAVYVGHAEADLAMTELFGGFSQRFYAAYREAAPLQEGYERRRDLYNLYHMLNHLNLFGRSYLGAVKRILGEYA